MMRLHGASSERVSLIIGLPLLLMMRSGLVCAANSTREAPSFEAPIWDDDKSAAARFADLAVSFCFEHGEDRAELEALARSSGWSSVGAVELKRNSGAASSMLAGWTFEGKSDAVAVMFLQENVSPPLYVCSLTAQLSGSETYERVRSALQSQLKTIFADHSETGGQMITIVTAVAVFLRQHAVGT